MKRFALFLSLLLLLPVGCGVQNPAAPPNDGEVEIVEPTLRDPQDTDSADETPWKGGPAEEEDPPEEAPSPAQPPESGIQEISGSQDSQEKDPVQPEDPVLQTAPQEGAMVALTFDDGPHAEYTDQILDILEENGAKATFFEVGRNLWNDADAVRRAEALGCEVGSHSYRHADLGKMSAEEIAADLQQADAVFTEVLGHVPNLLRPPYGSMNNAVKYTTGRSVVTWSIDTEDWLSRDVDKILAKVSEAGDLTGQVILMHSTYETSVEAARELVPWLMEHGYRLVTVTELITQHYGDQVLANGTYGYSYFKNGKDVILPPDQPKPDPPAQTETPAQTEPPAQTEDVPSQEPPDSSSQPPADGEGTAVQS